MRALLVGISLSMGAVAPAMADDQAAPAAVPPPLERDAPTTGQAAQLDFAALQRRFALHLLRAAARPSLLSQAAGPGVATDGLGVVVERKGR
jgi:hypothetical protein